MSHAFWTGMDNNNWKRVARILPVLGLALAPACAPMRPPAKNAGEARSLDGVGLAIARQGCSQTTEPEEPGADLVEERLEVHVRNGASEPVAVQRDKFRLLAPDGSALATVTWRAAEPLTVPGGQDGTFELRFMTRGGLACRSEMRLDARDALVLRGHPIALGAVSFVPEHAL
jgi:hypothetical protein